MAQRIQDGLYDKIKSVSKIITERKPQVGLLELEWFVVSSASRRVFKVS